ncbi:MAG: sigma-70 family RNA polymerase sigma factor [Candidatus Sumerlaeia bacterium]
MSVLSEFTQGSDSSVSRDEGPDDAQVENLVRSCAEGDEQAFESLVEIYQHKVYGLAWQLLKDADEAEDIAQEVFISCYRNIGNFRMESKFSTWLYRITVNTVKNRWKYHQRRKKKRHVSMDEPLSEDDDRTLDPADTRPNPRQEAEGQEISVRLHDALDALPLEQREVMVMRFMQDMQYEEIADALDLSLGTVKSRINRARKRVREMMGDAIEG